jgi:ribose-phosphate pyrophosphokinase
MITFKAKDQSGEIINSALTPFFFPAGEAHTKREEQRDLELIEIAIIQPDADSIHDDLFQLAMWNDYLKRENWDLTSTPEQQIKRVLILPYMPGARADRGTPFGLSVYADFMHSLELDQIIVFDPHSGMTGDQLHAASNKQTYVRPHELFDQVHMRAILNGYTAIIAPDKGAVGRASAVAELAGLPVITATKTRDEATGRLSNFHIDIEDKEGTYLIVDDICDGGGTFLGLAQAAGLDYGQLDLYVSHGVFSKEALSNLSKTFDYVYTTNSYNPTRDLIDGDQNRTFKRFDVIRPMLDRISY